MNSIDETPRVKAPSRILVTGTGGFAGRWLLRALARHKEMHGQIMATSHGGIADCRGVGKGASLEDTNELEFPNFGALLDVSDAEAVRSMIASFRPDAIIHLAAKSHVEDARRAPQLAWDVNFRGTENIAKAARTIVPDASFIYVSSAEAYGNTFNAWGQPVDETAPLAPANPYAASKAAADLLIGRMARDGLTCVRFRPFNHTGPGQSEKFVVAAFAAQIACAEHGLQERVLRVGNLDVVRDFLDVRDVVDAYTKALFPPQPLESGLVLNIASAVPRRIGDVLESLLTHANVPIRIEVDPERMRPNDQPIAVGDSSRARALLQWKPVIPWEQTVVDVLNYQRERAKCC
jgi:GDP-4-dehydro-6-deoxy-D-mannose reductase